MFPLLFEQIYALENPITSQLKISNELIIISGKWSVPVREANALRCGLILANSASGLIRYGNWLLDGCDFS